MSDGWEDLNGAELLWRQHKSHMSLYGEQYVWSFLVAKTIKNLPAMQETWVRSLGQKDPLGKGMATHSSILTWRIPWTEEPGGLLSMGSQSQTGPKWLSIHACTTPTHTSRSKSNTSCVKYFWSPSVLTLYLALICFGHYFYVSISITRLWTS